MALPFMHSAFHRFFALSFAYSAYMTLRHY